MPYNSPGILEVTDEYRYFECPGSRFVQLSVLEQALDINFGTYFGNGGASGASFAINDQTLFPGSNPIPQACDCIRYRNHTRGVRGRITIASRLASDLPSGVELSVSYVPSYFKLTPEGTVEVEFEGNINARGLNLPTGESLIAPRIQNLIRWLRRNVREELTGKIYNYFQVSRQWGTQVIGYNSTREDESIIEMGGIEGRQSYIRLIVGVESLGSAIRTLINNTRESSFLQFVNGTVTSQQLQIGITRIIANTIGQAVYEVRLRQAFSRRCEAIMCSTVNVETSWPTVRGCVVGERQSGALVLESPTRQTIELLYIAIGE